MKRITKQIFVLLIFTAGFANATFYESEQKEKHPEKKEKKKEKLLEVLQQKKKNQNNIKRHVVIGELVKIVKY